jgi:hypothetical protein
MKGAILIAPALLFFIAYVLTGSGLVPPAIQLVVLALVLILLCVTQIWTIFGFCGHFIQEYSTGESLSYGWNLIWGHKKLVVLVALPFLVIDLLLISSLVVTKGVTYDSAFTYTVTEGMALDNLDLELSGQRTNAPGPTEEGDYFRINRLVNGLSMAMLKARGVELLSIPMFFVDNKAIGLIAIVVSMLLIPVRISTWTLAYLEIADPVREFDSVIQDLHMERKAAALASGAIIQETAQPVPDRQPAFSPQLLRKRVKWVLIGIAFPLIMATVLFSICWLTKGLQVYLFSQPWQSGPLEGCPNWLPVDSRQDHFDIRSLQQEVFCAIEYDHVACQGKVAQLSEPVSREIPILMKPRCAGEFPVEIMILVGEGTASVSVQELEGLVTPQEIREGEEVTLTGFAEQAQNFTLTLEPVGGDAQNICFGTRVELDCPTR